MGDAWKGFLPTGDNLSSNYNFPSLGSPSSGLNNVYLSLTVPNSNGLALGYGGGLRTSLFGYFVRTDIAWSIDTPKKPVFYFALGTDF